MREAFLPHPGAAVLTGAWLLLALALGHGAARLAGHTRPARRPTHSARRAMARALAWTLTIGGAAAVNAAVDGAPAGFRMIAIVLAILVGMKAVVAAETAADGRASLSFVRWIGFAVFWFGMDPVPFARPTRDSAPGAGRLLAGGAIGAGLGVAGLVAARALEASRAPRLLIVVVLLASLSAVLHFGILRLLSGFWRLRGVRARDLFRAPILSVSLREFWGARWNLGFHEMTRTAVYRPLAPNLGRGGAILACFLFSGLLHEAAISGSVRAGYGGPLAYFALQGAFLLVESALGARGRSPGGAAGRLWTFACLILPLPLCFHAPFLEGVVLPLARSG